MDTALALLKEFGPAAALCVVLIMAIRQLTVQLIKAHTDRIATLEAIVAENTAEIKVLQDERTKRADESGKSHKEMALSYANIMADQKLDRKDDRAAMRDITEVLRHLVAEVGLCAHKQPRHEHGHHTPAPFDAVAVASKIPTQSDSDSSAEGAFNAKYPRPF